MITFRDVTAPQSFPGVPTRSVANATCTAWGHQSGSEQAPKMPSTIFSVLVIENIDNWQKISGNNGQLLNRCSRCNCDFFHPNVSLQLCRHQHTMQALTGDRKRPTTSFYFREPVDSREPVDKPFLTPDDSRTCSTYCYQNQSITKTAGTLQSSTLQNWPTFHILAPPAQ